MYKITHQKNQFFISIQFSMRNSITNSLQYTRDSMATFVHEQPLLFIIIGLILIRSIIASSIKRKFKKKYILPYENKVNTENQHFYIKYFRKVHSINSIGILIILALILIYILTKVQVIGSVLAVWVGAVILTFQTFVVSFLMYFVLTKKYQVGDHIKVCIDGTDYQWEILDISAFYIGIAGKNEYWESKDQYYHIPNNQLRLNPINKLNLSHDNYTKESIIIPYSNEEFRLPFNETVKEIQNFLNNYLPLRAASQVGNYKTYIGKRYKMSFTYQDGKTHIWIGFLTRRKDEESKMYTILAFIESLKNSNPKTK